MRRGALGIALLTPLAVAASLLAVGASQASAETKAVLVKDIRPGSDSSGLGELTNVNGTLFFDADDGIHGRELWKSDGTAAGTVLVKDINPGPDTSYAAELINFNGSSSSVPTAGLMGA